VKEEQQQPVPCVHLSCRKAATRKRRMCPRWRAERTPIPTAAGEARADTRGAAAARVWACAAARPAHAWDLLRIPEFTGVLWLEIARDIYSSIPRLLLLLAFHSNRASYSGTGDIWTQLVSDL